MPSKKNRKQGSSSRELPSKSEILDFLQGATDKVGKREIARAFHIRGDQRRELKELLAEMADEGLITGNRKQLSEPGKLPTVSVLEITGDDEHGETFATPVNWDKNEFGPPPKVMIRAKSGRKKDSSQGIPEKGARVLARLSRIKKAERDGYEYTGNIMKVLPKNANQLLGIYRSVPERGGLVQPIDKKQLKDWPVAKGDEGGASDGELVRFEILKAGRFGLAKARVEECLGNPDDQKAVSLIAIHAHGIRNQFPDQVIKEADALSECTMGQRENLRDIPLITIDPVDARDHDDAVWAMPDEDPDNKNGWIVLVAIADVSHYVTSSSELDIEARKRGNSVYFPDRVVPMLPERISNNLCSLKHDEERPCLAVKMIFDANGHKKGHRFIRGFMKSAAKLSYEQAQQAFDGKPDVVAKPITDSILKPLWNAYQALAAARDNRSPLDLDLPERKIVLDDQGQIDKIVIPERLEAHRLIEEFMIQANVCAAEELEKHKVPLVYRAHDAPSDEKITALAEFLSSLDIKVTKGTNMRPEHFNKILHQTKDSAYYHVVNEVVLRSQSQAEYTPQNAGHFGLNLRRYAHFTSPIRRYADLLVHRALISALELGNDGITDREQAELSEICKEISDLERKAMAAERDTIDRLVSSYLSEHVGSSFNGRISGVTKSGLFVRLTDTGADGFIPVSTMRDDYYIFDERLKSLVGERTKLSYRLGDNVEVNLVEVVPSAGAMRFSLISSGKKLPGKVSGSKQKDKGNRRGTTLRKSKRRRPK
ncbi:MAG: ribonuclease R [Methyloligellaceae bacterium]